MDDDDDVPDELWDVLDNLSHQKAQTVSQAPNVFQQQHHMPPPAGAYASSMAGSAAGPSTNTQWRPNLMQQLPLTAASKPKSLAQQLLGDNNSSFGARPGSSFPAPASTTANNTQQRWTPPPQVQYPPSWATTPGGNTQYQRPGQQQQQQQPAWPAQQGTSGSTATVAPSAGRISTSGALMAELGLPPPQAPPAAAAGVSTAAGGAAAVPGQQQQQQQQAPVPDELLRLQQEAEQLRSKLMAAEREKQMLQQEKQHWQQRMPSQSQHSMAQHRAQDLQKQLTTYQERLRFAEQEAQQAQSNAAEKSKMAREAEAQLKQLQDEFGRKEDMLQQLQVELEQEKQRTERLAATAAGTAVAGAAQPHGASSSSMQGLPHGVASPPAASASKGAGASARKRKGAAAAGAAAGTPGLSSAVKAAGAARTTPQQQQQLARLLGAAPATSVSFDLDMYDIDDADEQQQEQPEAPSQQQRPRDAPASAARAAAAAAPAGSTPQQQPVQQQQQDAAAPVRQVGAPAATAAPPSQPPPPQQPSLSSTFASKLVPALQRVQITTPKLSQLLWSTCQPAMQQLLQPLPSQMLGLSSILASTTTAAAAAAAPTLGGSKGHSSSNLTQQVPAALYSAQEQLSALTAGAVSSGSALLMSLLQLAAVLVPEGPLGKASNSSSSGDGVTIGSEVAAAAAAMQEAFPAGDEHSRPARWLLLPQQQSEVDSPVAVSRGSLQQEQHAAMLALPTGQQQQQQGGRFLVFRSALDASTLHILPLNLAVAVLQLLQHLAGVDNSCLSILAAQLSSSSVSSQPGGLQRQLSMGRREQGSSSSGSLQGAGGSSSSRVHIEWAHGSTGNTVQQAPARHALHSTGQHVQSVHLPTWQGLSAAAGDCGSSGGGSSLHHQQQRSLGMLLGDAARSHSSLLQHVGALLAAVAAQLPVDMQSVLLSVALSDQGVLLLLLQADTCGSRCAAAALLQHMLASPAMTGALTSALSSAASGEQQQQQQQQRRQQDDDVIMIDVADDQGPGTALQPVNGRGQAATRAATASGSRQSKAQQQQQQQQQHAAETTVGAPQQQHQQTVPALARQVVQEALMQLLECFSYGLDEAFQSLQHPSAQQRQVTRVLHATASSNGSRCSSLQAPAMATLQPAQGWGVFELQRRCCAVYAGLLHSRQELLLLYSMDPTAAAGYGLAQRLLVMVDAACSPVGGDPFAALTPQVPGIASASFAAAADGAGGTVCGSRCSWQGCLERVRLAHEGLLLLRALVATSGAVGTSAMADLSSNSTSLRLIMTTRAKLAEVTTALTAAASAGAAASRSSISSSAGASAQAPGSSRSSSSGANGSNATAGAAAVTALPLQPWAWPWSAQCGCKSKASSGGSSSSSGAGASGPGQQTLRVQHPPLQAVLQEMANTAASIHRRVMIHLRSQEAAMQS